MNKLTIIGSALLATLATSVFKPIAASAYDVFSYRYDRTKQTDSPDKEVRASKIKSAEPTSVPHDSSPAALRADVSNNSKETSSENSKPSKPTGSSSKGVLFSNPRK